MLDPAHCKHLRPWWECLACARRKGHFIRIRIVSAAPRRVEAASTVE